jgi:hypothetical protein
VEKGIATTTGWQFWKGDPYPARQTDSSFEHLEMNGDSYRLASSAKRQEQAKEKTEMA